MAILSLESFSPVSTCHCVIGSEDMHAIQDQRPPRRKKKQRENDSLKASRLPLYPNPRPSPTRPPLTYNDAFLPLDRPYDTSCNDTHRPSTDPHTTPLGKMIVLRVGHARPHNVAISDSFSDESVPGAMNVKYRNAVKWLSEGAVSTRRFCVWGGEPLAPRRRSHRHGTEGKGKGTDVGRVTNEDDGVERLERR